MQIVFSGYNLHEKLKKNLLGKKKEKKSIISLSSAELAKRVVKVKCSDWFGHLLFTDEQQQFCRIGLKMSSQMHCKRSKVIPLRIAPMRMETNISMSELFPLETYAFL